MIHEAAEPAPVTDAYLASLVRAHQGNLATVDGALARDLPDVVELVPPGAD